MMFLLTSCTWVKLTEAGAEVRLVEYQDVVACTKVGIANTHTQSKVGLKRNPDKVQEELLVLAQNHGAELGGNRIVAKTPAVEGDQSFDIYRCD